MNREKTEVQDLESTNNDMTMCFSQTVHEQRTAEVQVLEPTNNDMTMHVSQTVHEQTQKCMNREPPRRRFSSLLTMAW